MWKFVLVAVAVLVIGTIGILYWSYRQAQSEAEGAMAAIAGRAQSEGGTFDPATIAELPEVARRYFTHAIAPGARLSTTVELQMRGTFLLGDAENFQTYTMSARQVLAPPTEFVWLPSMQSGILNISGSDGLFQGSGWTRFWINWLVPVVNEGGSDDHTRSALTRAAIEAIWAPASLLPSNGVTWEQIGPNTARVTFPTAIEPIEMTLGPDGQVTEVTTMRWSNVNPESTFRLQPFGGTIEEEATFQGFTIPSVIRVGNHFGKKDYLPFFQAEITAADFL